MTEISELTNRELDARLAEAMGWEQRHIEDIDGNMYELANDPEFLFPPSDALGFESDEPKRVPPYSTDLSAVAEVEAEIERRGLRVPYFRELMKGGPQLVLEAGSTPLFINEIWKAITSMPRQRAEAALGVLEEKMTGKAMTADELQEMRDRLADEAMEWEKVDRVEGWQLYCWHDGTKLVVSYDSWRPDEKIEQAMTIKNKLVELGYSFTLGVYPASGEFPPISARFVAPNGDGVSRSGHAETDALAICLAAIKVLENKE